MTFLWCRMGLNSKRLGRLSRQFYSCYFFSSPCASASVDRACNSSIPEKLSLSTTSLLKSCAVLQPQQFGSVRFFAAPSWAKKTQDKDAKVIHTNEKITAQYIRLVTDEGHEVVTRREALYRAKSLDLDLVEVDCKADPPVCKIMDFHKEKFKKGARDKGLAKVKAESSIRKGDCKEVHFTGKIEQKDLQMKAETVKRIMERGYRVKVVAEPVKKGGETSDAEREDLGRALSRFYSLIEDLSAVESPPRVEKRMAYMIVRHAKFGTKKNPSKKVSKPNEEKENDVHVESGNLDPHHSRRPTVIPTISAPGMNSYPNQRHTCQSPVVGTMDAKPEYKNGQKDVPVSNAPNPIPSPALNNRYQRSVPNSGYNNAGRYPAQPLIDRRQNNDQFVPGDPNFRGRNPSQLPPQDNGQLGLRQRQVVPGDSNFRGRNPSQLPPQDNGQLGLRQRQVVPGDPNFRGRNPSQLPPVPDYIKRQGHLGSKSPPSSLPPHGGPSNAPKSFGMFSEPKAAAFDEQQNKDKEGK